MLVINQSILPTMIIFRMAKGNAATNESCHVLLNDIFPSNTARPFELSNDAKVRRCYLAIAPVHLWHDQNASDADAITEQLWRSWYLDEYS